ncbi:MAG: AMP-binding protein [Caldilineaceae bacterium]
MYITQSLKRAVQTNSQGIATIDGDRQQTWQQFAARVAKVAGAFQALGLAQGDRIAVLSLNSDRYLEVYYAVPWFGGVIVPLNTRLAVPELVYMLNDAGATCLLVDDTFAPLVSELQEQLETVRYFIHMGEGEVATLLLDYETLLVQSEPIPDVGRGGDALAGIFYTGGTTGLPKGVMLSHTNLMTNCLTLLSHVYTGGTWRYLHVSPMFHLAGGAFVSMVTIIGGIHCVISGFHPEKVAQAIQQQAITHVQMIPTMLNMFLNNPQAQTFELSSLQYILYGGSPMPEATIGRLRDKYPTCRLAQAYGMTELSPIATILDDEYHVFEGVLTGKTKSGGRPAFGVEVQIVGEKGDALPAGAIGMITVRGPNVMLGYWNKPEETAAVLYDGWMHTGDAGYIDEDGFVFIVDRLKDMIVTGGENVYSTEVENVLYRHPAVAMCAIIGIPHDVWGEQVHAIVVP